jgi:hypothetical protein
MPLTEDQHKPKPGEYSVMKQTILVKPDGTIDLLFEMQGSLELTVKVDDINKVSQRTGGDPVSSPVTSPVPVDAPEEDHGTGGPKRPKGEKSPTDVGGPSRPPKGR